MSYFLSFDGVNDYVSIPAVNIGGTVGDYIELDFAFNGTDNQILGRDDSFIYLMEFANPTTFRVRFNGEVNYDYAIDRPAVGVRFKLKLLKFSTGFWHILIDGIQEASVDIAGVAERQTFNCNTLGGVSGGSFTGTIDVYGFEIKRGGSVVSYLDPSASGGTGLTLPDTVGTDDGTLINFPVDNSQWVFYSEGGEITATSSLTLDGMAISSSTLLDIIASLNSTLSGFAISSSSENLVKTDSDITIDDVSIASGASVIDGISASSDFTLDDTSIVSTTTISVDGQTLFTLGDVSATGAASVLIECSSSIAFDDNSISSEASVITGVSANADFTLEDNAIIATASNLVTGSLSKTIDDNAVSSDANVNISASSDFALNNNSIVSEVIVTDGPAGNASFTLDNCTVSSTGAIDIDAISNFILNNIVILSDVDVEGQIVVDGLEIAYIVSTSSTSYSPARDTITYTIGSSSVTWVKV